MGSRARRRVFATGDSRRALRRLARLALLILLTGLAGHLPADVIVVNDDNGPRRDLQAALDEAVAGDTVLVLPGTYQGPFAVPEGVELISHSGPEHTILQGEGFGTGRLVTLMRDTAVRGFTLRDSKIAVDSYLRTADSVDLTGNIIENNELGGQLHGCDVEVSGNVIRGNGVSGSGVPLHLESGGLTVLGACTGSIITNNVITGNLGRKGAALRVISGGFVWPDVTHNTIAGNGDSPSLSGIVYFYQLGEDWGLPEGTVTNNVIVGNPGGGMGTGYYVQYYPDCGCYADWYGAYGPIIENNQFYDNGGQSVSSPRTSIGQDGNVVVDPLLVDIPAGDFRLQPGSPAIDSAADLGAGAPPTDFTGAPRSLDGDLDGFAAPDLGAYEQPGDIETLVLAADGTMVSWSPRPGTLMSHLYRGDLGVLRAGGDYSQDTNVVPTAQQWCDLTTSTLSDTDIPAAGAMFFYLVSPVDVAEGVLGFDSARQPRPNANPCAP